jgi:hypothetical protein
MRRVPGASTAITCLLLVQTGMARAEDPSNETLHGDMDAGEGAGSFAVRGYAKSLLVRSREEQDGDRWVLSLNRLRVNATAATPSGLELHVEHDTELRVGTYVDTAEFRQIMRPSVPEHYLSIDWTLSSGAEHWLSQRFFRLYARISLAETDVTVGRQRIPLGTGRMWSALDVLNPVNPLRVERDEYVGVDAVEVEQRLGALTRLLAVYAPAVGGEEDRAVVRFQTNAYETDAALTAGTYWGNRFIGVDLATQVLGAGVYGELAWTSPQVGGAHLKGLIGVGYALFDTVSIAAEAYATAQDGPDRRASSARNPQLLRVQPVGARYAGFSIAYEPTPVLAGTAFLIVNLEDASRIVAPSVSYTFAGDWVVSASAQLGGGEATSEFGQARALWSAQLQRYF